MTLNIGDTAPDFELPSDSGQPVKLSDYRGKRVVLYFYPQDDTPGCTKQSCGFRDAYPQIEEKNAVVLGVSPDDMASHQKFKTKFNLPFTLLVDEGHTIADVYGVWGEKALKDRMYVGIFRSHFVIDENGKLVDVQIGIKPDDSVAQALEKI